jgi:hypothetical protein
MKQDEIIEMAKQAGGIPFRDSEIMGWGCEFDIEPLEAFAKLVAAKEREACADLCATYYDPMYAEYDEAGNELATAIRARGGA